MSDTPAIRHDVETRTGGEVHHVTVDNPEKLNVLGSTVTDALRETLDRVAASESARVVVLRGAGDRAWIGGADIREMATLDAQSAVVFIRRLHGVCQALRELPVPAIAAIRGWCLGAGLEVAACCDLRLASDDARFGMPEVRVGLPSVIEAAVLPRLVGAGRARDLVMTGRVVDAAEALRWGLLDGVAPAAGLDALVDTRVGEILQGAPRALRIQKLLCRAWEELPLDEAVETGVHAFGSSFRSDEPREYLDRFLARTRNGS